MTILQKKYVIYVRIAQIYFSYYVILTARNRPLPSFCINHRCINYVINNIHDISWNISTTYLSKALFPLVFFVLSPCIVSIANNNESM